MPLLPKTYDKTDDGYVLVYPYRKKIGFAIIDTHKQENMFPVQVLRFLEILFILMLIANRVMYEGSSFYMNTAFILVGAILFLPLGVAAAMKKAEIYSPKKHGILTQ